MVIGTGIYVEAPRITPARGGLMAVASVIDSADPHVANGVTYLSENCGVNSVVQGDNCLMGSVTISQEGVNLTITLANVPVGVYTFSVTGETDVVDSTAPYSATFDITGAVAPITVTVTSTAGLTYTRVLDALPVAAPIVEAAANKVPGQITVVEGEIFNVYRMVECLDLVDDDTGWARNAFALGEAHGIEEGFMRTVLARTDTTVVDGTGLSLIDAIALAEEYAGNVYGGIATIHVTRGVTTRALSEQIFENSLDWTITTRQGNWVANGSGYSANLGPTGVEPGANESWLYVTGYVEIHRGPLNVIRDLDWENNNQLVLAERPYAVTVDCFKAAILIDLSL